MYENKKTFVVRWTNFSQNQNQGLNYARLFMVGAATTLEAAKELAWNHLWSQVGVSVEDVQRPELTEDDHGHWYFDVTIERFVVRFDIMLVEVWTERSVRKHAADIKKWESTN